MRRATLLLLALLLTAGTAPAQDAVVAQRLNVYVSFPKKLRVNVSYAVNVRSPVPIFKNVALTPFVDVKVSLFSNHLGGSLLRQYRSRLYANLTFSYGGLASLAEAAAPRLVPVFTTTYANPLNTEYLYNAGAATSYTFQLALLPPGDRQAEGADPGSNLTAAGTDATIGPARRLLRQKVGNVMLSVGDVYLNYYNDGGPGLKYLGDGEDRYWTGGGTLGALIRRHGDIHQLELAFDKFTGFSEHAFHAMGLLFVDNVLYHDTEQLGYNAGRIALRYFNHGVGIGGSINRWNTAFDFQDFIHREISRDPYHPKIESPYVDVEIFRGYRP